VEGSCEHANGCLSSMLSSFTTGSFSSRARLCVIITWIFLLVFDLSVLSH
jgi:hypothetical protein